MKFQRLIFALRPDSAARLPVALAALLLACLVLQIALPSETELPPQLPVGRAGSGAGLPPVLTVAPTGALLQRPLFAPRSVARSGAGGDASALGGAVVAGTISVRGAMRAVVKRSDGSIGYLPVGGALAGWRLVRLDTGNAWFQKGGQRLSIPYGAAAPAAREPEEDETEEEEKE